MGWSVVGITLLLIIVGEVGLRLALTAKDRFMSRPRIDGWTWADAYHGAEWIHDYHRELESALPFVWRPYVYWRRPSYQGRTINVDRNNRRATWNPPPRDGAADPTPVRVFTFGGSTMWGARVRDDHTVASHLSKLLHERGYRAEVTNYGEVAYVSTQAAITLLRCIHRGEAPDIALFYDGINDVIASYLYGEAGIPHNEAGRRAEFNLLDRPRRMLRYFSQQLRARGLWGFGRVAGWVQRRVRSPPDNRPRTRPPRDEVARQALHAYASNLAFVESLGRRYGFEPLFYWQPNIFSKRHRSPREQAIAASSSVSKEMYDDIYRRVQRSAALDRRPRFHNISDLFDELEEPYYVDATHLSESGNRLIAAAMVEDVIELIEFIRGMGTVGSYRD